MRTMLSMEEQTALRAMWLPPTFVQARPQSAVLQAQLDSHAADDLLPDTPRRQQPIVHCGSVERCTVREQVSPASQHRMKPYDSPLAMHLPHRLTHSSQSPSWMSERAAWQLRQVCWCRLALQVQGCRCTAAAELSLAELLCPHCTLTLALADMVLQQQ